MKDDKGIFSSSEAKVVHLLCHSLSRCFNQAGPLSYLLLLSSSMLIDVVPMSAGWLTVTRFQGEALAVSSI